MSQLADALVGRSHPAPRSHVSDYLACLAAANAELADACDYVAMQHERTLMSIIYYATEITLDRECEAPALPEVESGD